MAYFERIKIYPANKANPDPVIVDERFPRTTITVTPLNISGSPAESELNEEMLTETNAVASTAASLTGTVTVKATPPNTFHKYDMPDNVVSLDDPSFISTNVPVQKLWPTFSGVAGCTHVAVSVIGHE